MFSLFKFLVFLLPSNLVMFIGEPFKWAAESSIRNWSPKDLEEEFSKAKFRHYENRIFAAIGTTIVLIFLAGLFLFIPGILFYLIVGVIFILFAIDGFVLFCRFLYMAKEQKIAASRNEIVPLNSFTDTSWESIKAKHAKEREEHAKEFFERTGRYPTKYDY